MGKQLVYILSLLGTYDDVVKDVVNVASRFPGFMKQIKPEPVAPNIVTPTYVMTKSNTSIVIKPNRIDVVFSSNGTHEVPPIEDILAEGKKYAATILGQDSKMTSRIAINADYFFEDNKRVKLDMLARNTMFSDFGKTISELGLRVNFPTVINDIQINDIVNLSLSRVSRTNSFSSDLGILLRVDCNTSINPQLSFSVDHAYGLLEKMAAIVNSNVSLLKHKITDNG